MGETSLKTFTSFESQVKGVSGLVLLDFYADWCGPCKQMAPILEDLALELSGIQIYKVDIDKHSNFASVCEVRSIPTLALFKNGELLDRRVGAIPKVDLKTWIQKHLT